MKLLSYLVSQAVLVTDSLNYHYQDISVRFPRRSARVLVEVPLLDRGLEPHILLT